MDDTEGPKEVIASVLRREIQEDQHETYAMMEAEVSMMHLEMERNRNQASLRSRKERSRVTPPSSWKQLSSADGFQTCRAIAQ